MGGCSPLPDPVGAAGLGSGAAILAGIGMGTGVWGKDVAAGTAGIGSEEGVEITLMMAGTT